MVRAMQAHGAHPVDETPAEPEGEDDTFDPAAEPEPAVKRPPRKRMTSVLQALPQTLPPRAPPPPPLPFQGSHDSTQNHDVRCLSHRSTLRKPSQPRSLPRLPSRRHFSPPLPHPPSIAPPSCCIALLVVLDVQLRFQ